jgi:hypothetical protein
VRFLDRLNGNLIYEAIFMVEVAEHMTADQFRCLLCSLTEYHLNGNGLIAVTTPLVDVTGPSETNPHHVCEYSFNDFIHTVMEACMVVKQYNIETVPCTAGETMEQGTFILERKG